MLIVIQIAIRVAIMDSAIHRHALVGRAKTLYHFQVSFLGTHFGVTSLSKINNGHVVVIQFFQVQEQLGSSGSTG